MKQANYNGPLRGSVGGVGGVGRGVDSLAPPPGCDLFGYHIFPPHVASLRAAQYGVTHGCDPSGVPCSLASNWVADCVPWDAASSTALRAIGLPIACPTMPI